MPNYCNFDMRVTGPAKGIERLYKAATTDYYETADDNEHLWRVFEFSHAKHTHIKDDIYSVDFYGYCAWSMYSCMFDGEFTYQSSSENHKGVTLPQLSKEENLVIEAYSQEPGMCFSEYILINKGEIIAEKEEEYYEFYSDVDPDTLVKYGGLHWDQDQINEYFKTNDTLVICKYNWEYKDHVKLYEEDKHD